MSTFPDSELMCNCTPAQAMTRKTCKKSDKNPENVGRDFFACPVGSRAYGGCGAFVWAARDDAPSSPAPSQAAPRSAPATYSGPLRPVAVNEAVRRPHVAPRPTHVGLSRPNQPSVAVAALNRAEAHDSAAMLRRLEAMEKQMQQLQAMNDWLEKEKRAEVAQAAAEEEAAAAGW